MRSQHCGYWCPGAKAPGHQYPQCWLNIHCIGPVSYKNIAHKLNSIRKWNYILKKKWPSYLRVNLHMPILHILIITMPSLGFHGFSSHGALDCLFISLPNLSTNKISTFCIIGAGFSSQTVSNAQSNSMSWLHHISSNWCMIAEPCMCFHICMFLICLYHVPSLPWYHNCSLTTQRHRYTNIPIALL